MPKIINLTDYWALNKPRHFETTETELSTIPGQTGLINGTETRVG